MLDLNKTMLRMISPPKDQLDTLRQPLTAGEKIVFDFFERHLPVAWEIYLQPHLNGLRPDFVLLNPNVGIAVFEVKDWDLDALERWMEPRPGQSPKLMGRRDGKVFSLQDQNPVEKVYQYKQEIEELYCPRLSSRAGYVVINAGVIFPFAANKKVQQLFEVAREYRDMLRYERYFPLAGKEALKSGDIRSVFPEAFRETSKHMKPKLAQDLRNWLIEPDAPVTQRRPLELDDNQKAFVTTRTDSGYRRIKGPAGSGKSLVLAARAAQLISEGKQVLVITYNITLLHYLMDLAVRWPHPNGSTRQDVTWLNFHRWCKRACQEAGHEDDYDALWKQPANDKGDLQGSTLNEILASHLPELVSRVLDEDSDGQVSRYDAVLVDEGQDFLPSWWRLLRKACKQGGEMLLVADATQDTYGAAAKWPHGAWTDRSMTGAGFSGPWAKLAISYRTPPKLTELARIFAEKYLPKELRDLPNSPQLELNLYPCQLRWIQTDEDRGIKVCLNEILDFCRAAEPELLSISDITFLVEKKATGRVLVKELEQKGFKIVHTFDIDDKESRRQKVGFYMGDARIKGTTLHSFKGWEARAIVIYRERAGDPESLALLYSGITRLKRHEHKSFLTVVCAVPSLAEYGRTWPQYEVL
ncbi:MAG: hypothetical protein BroJett014_24110 [Planctomycetota bacterium]|nr:MAG: hypothetical protein BroJett014_24110 [Planctomycetota bacterium]